MQGSLDVVSLGHEGVIEVELGVSIVDDEGPDFIVFENVFRSGPLLFAEAGEVAVSDDGEVWTTFPCAHEDDRAGCAGLAPVFSHPDNDIAPDDIAAAGGDAFDLADIGVAGARYVRIIDRSPSAGEEPNAGFDLDAVSVVSR